MLKKYEGRAHRVGKKGAWIIWMPGVGWVEDEDGEIVRMAQIRRRTDARFVSTDISARRVTGKRE